MIRFFDILFSFIGIILFSPLFLIIGICIMIESRGGVMYKQMRVGKNDIDFELYKFRSMFVESEKKGLLTIGFDDKRITKTGSFLRKYKLDELPQLINVLIGDMSLVGPRPEVRKYVKMYNKEQRKVLSIKPGITDYASVEYIDENLILGKSEDPEKFYVEEILPHKIKFNMKYIDNYNLVEYFKVIILTIYKIIK